MAVKLPQERFDDNGLSATSINGRYIYQDG